jgi:Coenzyme PQQ synthesis protein D (PqqD)
MKSYSIEKTGIVYEILKNEVIIVNFTSGNYYALVHIAGLIWQMLEKQISAEAIEEFLCTQFGCEKSKAASDVQGLIDELLAENLISLNKEPANAATEAKNPIDLAAIQGWTYDPPRLTKFTDIQDLLLLDPIHEVTEEGWPNKIDE